MAKKLGALMGAPKVKGFKAPAVKMTGSRTNPLNGRSAFVAVPGGMFQHARPEGVAHAPGGVGRIPLPAEHSSAHN